MAYTNSAPRHDVDPRLQYAMPPANGAVKQTRGKISAPRKRSFPKQQRPPQFAPGTYLSTDVDDPLLSTPTVYGGQYYPASLPQQQQPQQQAFPDLPQYPGGHQMAQLQNAPFPEIDASMPDLSLPGENFISNDDFANLIQQLNSENEDAPGIDAFAAAQTDFPDFTNAFGQGQQMDLHGMGELLDLELNLVGFGQPTYAPTEHS